MKDWNEAQVNGHSAKDAADREHARQLNGGSNGQHHALEPCAANEDAIADRFAEKFKDTLRYCHSWATWLRWDEICWVHDDRKLAFHFAREAAREANVDGKATPAKASTAAGVERFAQADPRLSTVSDDWDRDPFKLATPGGTVNLRTGENGPANPADHITKRTAVAPAPPGTATPRWSKFLHDATKGDADLIAYLRRLLGYCLTGDTSEQMLGFFHGGGGNGKGVLVNTFTAILGDYATVAPMEAFTASKSDRHPTELAMLQGARFVTAQETEEGRGWNEPRIKQLTGGDPITARFMKMDFFTYVPMFKLILVGNNKPNLKSVDDAIRRRFQMVPFIHKPAAPDPKLTEKLRDEWSGILRWAIDGCLDWQRQRLNPPEIVLEATKTYFDDQDSFRVWLDEHCELGPNKADTTAALFASWRGWAARNGDDPGNARGFTARMTKAGFEPTKHTPGLHGRRGFKGVALNYSGRGQE
jgi:putative DNA primase/helicase